MNHKLYFALSLTLLFGLSACHKTNDQTSGSQSTASDTLNPTSSSTVPMNPNQMNMASSTPMTKQPAHILAYMDIMDKMHSDMSAGIKAKNADVDFAQGMIAHHQGAIAMAKVELQYGKDNEMKALAQKIIDTQQGEINFMQTWLAKNEANQEPMSNADEISKAYQDKNMANHDAMMQGTMDMDADVAFAKGMIPHHQGAEGMANVELQYGKNTEMRKLANQIKQAQTPEIKQMQNWLKTKSK